jgi:hypothetical protein
MQGNFSRLLLHHGIGFSSSAEGSLSDWSEYSEEEEEEILQYGTVE